MVDISTFDLDRVEENDVNYLNFKNSSDSRLHRRLTHLGEQAGITGKNVNFCKSFLSHRELRVNVNVIS